MLKARATGSLASAWDNEEKCKKRWKRRTSRAPSERKVIHASLHEWLIIQISASRALTCMHLFCGCFLDYSFVFFSILIISVRTEAKQWSQTNGRSPFVILAPYMFQLNLQYSNKLLFMDSKQWRNVKLEDCSNWISRGTAHLTL